MTTPPLTFEVAPPVLAVDVTFPDVAVNVTSPTLVLEVVSTGPQGLPGGTDTQNAVALAAVTVARLVSMSGGQAQHLDPSDPTIYGRVFGIALNSAMPGNTVTVQTSGRVSLPGFLTLIPDRLYYAGPDGTLVSTAPTTGVLIYGGWSEASDVIHLDLATVADL